MARAEKLFTRLRAARLDNTLDAEFRRLTRLDLLIIDLSRPRDYPDRRPSSSDTLSNLDCRGVAG